MIVDMLEALGMELAAESYSGTWWTDKPPPKPYFTVFGAVIYDFVSLLWTTNLGIVISVSTGVAAMAYLFAVITTYLIRCLRWMGKKWSIAPLKPGGSKMPHPLCYKPTATAHGWRYLAPGTCTEKDQEGLLLRCHDIDGISTPSASTHAIYTKPPSLFRTGRLPM